MLRKTVIIVLAILLMLGTLTVQNATAQSFTDSSKQNKWWNCTLAKGFSDFETGHSEGEYNSLVVDNSEGLHLCYSHYYSNYPCPDSNDLIYAYKPLNGKWSGDTVERGISSRAEAYNSIAMDSLNGVHICYRIGNYSSNFHFNLRLAYKPCGGNWSKYDVDSEEGVDLGSYNSIAIDHLNETHISYYDETNKNLKYAYKPSGNSTWVNSTVDSSSGVGTYTSIAIDKLNGVHISYYDETNKDLKYAYKPSGGKWTNCTIDSIGDVGYATSMVIDKLNTTYIGYYGYNNQTYNYSLKCAYKIPGDTWKNCTLDPFCYGTGISMAVDNSNEVHISYLSNNFLKDAYKTAGGSWTNETVDQCYVWRECTTSITIDSLNEIYISYHSGLDLKLASTIELVPEFQIPVFLIGILMIAAVIVRRRLA